MTVSVPFHIAENISRFYGANRNGLAFYGAVRAHIMERGACVYGGAWAGSRVAPAWALPWNRNRLADVPPKPIFNKQRYGMYYHR